MTIEKMLREYYASWATGDPDKVAAFFKDTSVFEDLAFEAKFEGREGVRSFAKLTYSGAPDFKVEPTRILVDGTSAAATWVMRGTHSGDLPGLPATGKAFQVRASSVIRIEDGKILEILDFWNPIAFQREVGLLQGG